MNVADVATGVIQYANESTPYFLPMSAGTSRPDRKPAPPHGGTSARALARHQADDRSARAVRAVALGMALRQRRTKGEASATGALLIDEVSTQLAHRVRAHLPSGAVKVTLTDNRYTMISVRRLPREQRYELRLHHMFADADPVIVRALARYAADNDRAASRVLGNFIDGNQPNGRGLRRSPREVMVTAGEVHDLREIFDELNQQYFGGKIDANITWGPRLGAPRRRNSIKMGSYVIEDRLIRMHRTLDRTLVPRFFVAWIVFHEMLHQVHDVTRKGRRREFHSKDFMTDEARFEFYDEARCWERAHLDDLLSV